MVSPVKQRDHESFELPSSSSRAISFNFECRCFRRRLTACIVLPDCSIESYIFRVVNDFLALRAERRT